MKLTAKPETFVFEVSRSDLHVFQLALNHYHREYLKVPTDQPSGARMLEWQILDVLWGPDAWQTKAFKGAGSGAL